MLYFTVQNRLQDWTGKVSEAAGARWRFHGRIMVGLWSDYRRTVFESSFYWRKHFREFPLKSWASRFRGRRSIWWGWRVTLLAPRIGNDVSYVMQIKDAIHFAWQAQYLLSLKGDFTCSAHWEWRFICDADHWWHWFCVAGAVCGEVGRWLFVAGAALRHFVTFWEIAGARNVVFYNTKSSPRSDQEGLRSGGCEMTNSWSDYGRIIVGMRSNRLSIGGSNSEILRWNVGLRISWQA